MYHGRFAGQLIERLGSVEQIAVRQPLYASRSSRATSQRSAHGNRLPAPLERLHEQRDACLFE